MIPAKQIARFFIAFFIYAPDSLSRKDINDAQNNRQVIPYTPPAPRERCNSQYSRRMDNCKVFLLLFCHFIIKSYFCSNRFRHASHRTAYQGGTFALYRFYGIHKTTDRLSTANTDAERTRIDNQNARQALELEQLRIISYFRLANYLRPMEQDKIAHIFKPNSTFENALDLYYFETLQ